MAYKSIPRVNKMGTSMYWESGIFFKKYSWISIKLIVFLKYFNRFFFLLPTVSYKLLWILNNQKMFSFYSLSNFYTFNSKLFTKKNKFLIFFSNFELPDKNNLKTYLYCHNTKYYVFFLYLNESQTFEKEIKLKPKQRINREFIISYLNI